MTLAILLAALGLDYYRPLARPSSLDAWLGPRADWLHDHLNEGGHRHGWLAWGVGALLPAAVVGMCVGILHALSAPLAWVASGVALYFAMGYREIDQRARDMLGALVVLDLERARRFCGDWCDARSADAEAMSGDALRATLRLSIERLFAPMFWFVVLGVFGVALHGLSRYLAERWRTDSVFSSPARVILHWLEWLPARALAFSFAIVGNFDRAFAAWRAGPDATDNASVVRGAGAGALGVRLEASPDGGPLSGATVAWDMPSAEYVEGGLRLVLRVLLLWLALFALVWLAGR